MATIEQARAAICHAHAAEGTAKGDNPARHPVVAETVMRTLGGVQSALEQSTEDGRLDVAPVPLGGFQELAQALRLNSTGPKTVKLETGVEECFA